MSKNITLHWILLNIKFINVIKYDILDVIKHHFILDIALYEMSLFEYHVITLIN